MHKEEQKKKEGWLFLSYKRFFTAQNIVTLFFLIILVLHEVVAPVEDMDFTRPTIRQKKMKSTCKPKATIFDARPSYMARTNPALEFRKENQVTK